jgi:hypothetical protein
VHLTQACSFTIMLRQARQVGIGLAVDRQSRVRVAQPVLGAATGPGRMMTMG